MKTQKFEEIENLIPEYSMIPICKEIYADVITPISLLRKICLQSFKNNESLSLYVFYSVRHFTDSRSIPRDHGKIS